MTNKTIEWGAIITLALAIIGFAFWLGRIQSKLEQLDPPTLVERIINLIPHDLPKGTIIAWNTKTGVVPKGWALCNGENGTPDLRGRFLRGTVDFADVGKTGGVDLYRFEIAMTEEHLMPPDHRIARVPRPAENLTKEKTILPPYLKVVFIIKTE